MKHIIIGTAGHIDHGKTTLIKALTGRNTDRWEEEQRRGITIDLGFTYFDLPNGDRAGIIDVPGHERFINNMVAGVVGMDLVMLVIAADEGIMPQTREHMDILGELGIEKSIIVLNKCDLVDEEWMELVEEEVREELHGTFLENAPIVKVSAATGEGLPDLIDTIQRMTENEVTEKDIHTIPRLPIDRAFTISGFGTIITGTLLAGTIRKEDTLCMYPIGKECKIRNIQVHGENVDVCYAGQRVAINLSNIKKSEIKRGCVLAPPKNMKNTDLLDVRLNVLPSSMRILTNNARLHLFTGTSEVLCRAVLLDKEEIGPGESGFVQLRLEEEIAVRRGDRFVVRFYSPMETIGGGVILEPNPKWKKRFQPDVIEELKKKESGSSADVIELHIRQHDKTMVTVAELAKITALAPEEVEEDVKELEGFHKAHPYRPGMPKAEVHMRFMKQVKPNVFDMYIEMLINEGKIGRSGEYLHAPAYEIPKDAVFEKASRTILETFEKAGYDFVRFSEIVFPKLPDGVKEDVLQVLISNGTVVKINDEMYTLASYMEKAKAKIIEKLQKDGLITIAEVRDMFGTSRKSAKPILEYMDSQKVTKKTGAESERVAYL